MLLIIITCKVVLGRFVVLLLDRGLELVSAAPMLFATRSVLLLDGLFPSRNELPELAADSILEVETSGIALEGFVGARVPDYGLKVAVVSLIVHVLRGEFQIFI